MRIPAFTLSDASGQAYSFPSAKPSLLCFVKEDCPTSHLSMPLIEAAHSAFGTKVDIVAIGQDAVGNAVLADRYGLTLPMLDDSALKVSFEYYLDTVPTIILVGPDGGERRKFVGFGRDDWLELYGDLSAITGLLPPDADWDALPVSSPGCGSKSSEPEIAERLRAEAEGSPLRARRIQLGTDEDEVEFLYAKGFSDGYPLVPPTPERVLRMLSGTKRDAQEVVAIVPPNMAPVTIEKIAINAVMAGCKPEYLPVVIAAVEAVCTDTFNIHGIMATLAGASPVVVVNGPIREKIGLNMQGGALGRGYRANTTIGHALMLVLRNVGGSRTGGTDRSTLGTPMKRGLCFAEFEERSPWEPLHVERGYSLNQSAVTIFGLTRGPQQMTHMSCRTGDELIEKFSQNMSIIGSSRDVLLVVGPEHIDIFARSGYSKDDIRRRLKELTGELEPELLQIVVAGGGAGGISAYFMGWLHGPRGSIVTDQIIEEV